MEIIVDPEFERLMRPLTEQEFLQLECSVLDDGLLNPLVVWAPQNILLDGHHRLRNCGSSVTSWAAGIFRRSKWPIFGAGSMSVSGATLPKT